MAETVTIPAILLAHLVWAAESLSNIEPDKDDREMIQEARRAIEQQAPTVALVMLEIDVACTPPDGRKEWAAECEEFGCHDEQESDGP